MVLKVLVGTAVVVVMVADDVPSVFVGAAENNKALLVENDRSVNEDSLLMHRVYLLEDKDSDLLDKGAVVGDVQVE